MRIANVAVTVSLDNGDTVTLNVADPAPGGDNPAFLGSQLHVALDMLERRHFDVIETSYGKQQFRPARPSDELLSPRVPGSRPERVLDASDNLRLKAEGRAPANGSHVRFPKVYGPVVFEVKDRELGAYVVAWAPAGSNFEVGAAVQINTDVDVASWEDAS